MLLAAMETLASIFAHNVTVWELAKLLELHKSRLFYVTPMFLGFSDNIWLTINFTLTSQGKT